MNEDNVVALTSAEKFVIEFKICRMLLEKGLNVQVLDLIENTKEQLNKPSED